MYDADASTNILWKRTEKSGDTTSDLYNVKKNYL